MRTEKSENGDLVFRSSDGRLHNSKKEARKADRDLKIQQRDEVIANLPKEQRHRLAMHYSYSYYGDNCAIKYADADYIFGLIPQEERMAKRYWAIFSYSGCCSTSYGIHEFDELDDLQQHMNDYVSINLDFVLDTQTWQHIQVDIDVQISLQWREQNEKQD